MQRHILGSLPTPLTNIFEDQTRSTQIQSRSATQIVQAPTRFTKCNQAIRCTVPLTWNSLPSENKFIMNCNNGVIIKKPLPLGTFVSKIKKYALTSISFI